MLKGKGDVRGEGGREGERERGRDMHKPLQIGLTKSEEANLLREEWLQGRTLKTKTSKSQNISQHCMQRKLATLRACINNIALTE